MVDSTIAYSTQIPFDEKVRGGLFVFSTLPGKAVFEEDFQTTRCLIGIDKVYDIIEGYLNLPERALALCVEGEARFMHQVVHNKAYRFCNLRKWLQTELSHHCCYPRVATGIALDFTGMSILTRLLSTQNEQVSRLFIQSLKHELLDPLAGYGWRTKPAYWKNEVSMKKRQTHLSRRLTKNSTRTSVYLQESTP